jgi:hypothetical protein
VTGQSKRAFANLTADIWTLTIGPRSRANVQQICYKNLQSMLFSSPITRPEASQHNQPVLLGVQLAKVSALVAML